MQRLAADLRAGTVGAIVTIPQAIAYGLIAFAPLGPAGMGLGIFSAFLASVVFGAITALFGSGGYLVSGPRAVTALLLAVALGQTIERGIPVDVGLSMVFVIVSLAGLIQALFGILRLGRAVAFIPQPVLAGFTNASAILVVISQIPFALGLEGGKDDLLNPAAIASVSPEPLTVSLITVVVIFLSKRFIKSIPAALVGLIVGAAVYHAFNLGWQDSAVLGASAMTLPSFSISPEMRDPEIWRSLLDLILPAALSIALLATFDTVLSGQALSERMSYENKPNRDLIVHGLGNILMGLIGGLPSSGTTTRSVGVIEAGGRGRGANIWTAILTGLSLLILARAIVELPVWASAGMLIATSLQALDKTSTARLRRLISGKARYPSVLAGDLSVDLAVVAIAVAVDLIAAVGSGVVMAALLFMFGVGRTAIRRVYRGDKVHSKTARPPPHMAALETHGRQIAVIELEGALFFGTADRLRRAIRAALDDGARQVILDLKRLSSLDSTGAGAIRKGSQDAATAGGSLALSYPGLGPGDAPEPADHREFAEHKSPEPGEIDWIRIRLQENGILSAVPPDRQYGDIDTALMDVEDRLLASLEVGGRLGGDTHILRNAPLLKGLDRKSVGLLAQFVRRHAFRPGETVFRQTENDDRAFLLVAGRMNVMVDIPGSGRRRRIGTLSPGAVFGEMAMIDGRPRSATVIAIDRCAALCMDRDAFERLSERHPEIALALMRNLGGQFAERLRLANATIAELER